MLKKKEVKKSNSCSEITLEQQLNVRKYERWRNANVAIELQ